MKPNNKIIKALVIRIKPEDRETFKEVIKKVCDDFQHPVLSRGEKMLFENINQKINSQ